MALSDKDRRVLRAFTATVLGRYDELEVIRRAAPPGEPDRAWREALLQSHLFSGIPRTVEAFEVLDRAGGLGVLDADEAAGEDDLPDRGRSLFDIVYAESAPQVLQRLSSFHPDLARWIMGHAYGRVLTRSGLTPAMRELLAVAALSALGPDRQLASHVRGAIRAGATPQEVFAVLSAIADLVDAERLDRAQAVLERFAR
jgi:4-carboxymuconolactone decarboxylase